MGSEGGRKREKESERERKRASVRLLSRISAYLGLLHSLSADWTPEPQVLEQWDHVLHWPQSPFTVSGSLPTTTHSPEMHH